MAGVDEVTIPDLDGLGRLFKCGVAIGSRRSMSVDFRKAVIPDELEALCAFDRVAFAQFPSDLFEPEEWAEFDSYWMIVDGEIVGCSAFMHDVDLDEKPKPGSLWIVSTGALPVHQGKGFGTKQKEWQIGYAKQHGFKVIVTNMRQSNSKIINANDKLGFTTREVVPDYYLDPTRGCHCHGVESRSMTTCDFRFSIRLKVAECKTCTPPEV